MKRVLVHASLKCRLIKASLHKHILHASPDLQRQICYTVENF
uniref:Uncharacterized protein n=1 Tax=Solanum lycopersicum TaxID=4081 RepID=K4AU28_SOLLC